MIYTIARRLGYWVARAPLLTVCIGVGVVGYAVWPGQVPGASEREREIARQHALAVEAQAARESAPTRDSMIDRQLSQAREARERIEQASAKAKLDAERFEKQVEASPLRSTKGQWYDRCMRWGREARKPANKVGAEAMRRNLADSDLVNQLDAASVAQRLPRVGMTACGMFAVLGRPDDRNVTTTSSSTRVQWVYSNRSIYVYTRGEPENHNGVIDAVQE